MLHCLLKILVCLAVTFGSGTVAIAQAPQGATTQSGPAAAPTAALSFYGWIAQKQADYNRKFAQTIREIRTEPFAATLLLGLLSFAYGVLHAAGPGHGKAVISSYVLANERTVRRGIALSFLAALFQAISAILLVGILVFVFQASGLTRKASEAWLETVSWGIVTLLGAWLLWGQIRKLIAARSTALPDHGHVPEPPHNHSHDHQRHSHDHVHHGHSSHAHHHGHADANCDHCGHAHMPDPQQLEGQWSWPKALALAAAVGIRPCTGAVFVLGFALSQGLVWAGIFATFAMALGTAITVSALAAIAVGSRELAAWLSGGSSSNWSWHVRTAAGLIGSFGVMILGFSLFLGSLGAGSAL